MKPMPGLRWRYLALKVRAVLLLAAGRRVAALIIFERMLQLAPEDQYALASQAHVQMQLHQVDAAIASLQALTGTTGLGAGEAVSWFNLGYALQQGGRIDEAVSAFKAALTRDPRLDRAWYGLALVLMEQSQFHGAVEALERNIALQPMSPHGWYRLAQVWLALGDVDKALTVVARLRSFEPSVAAQLERENGLLRAALPKRQMRRELAPGATGSSVAQLDEVRNAAH